MKHSFVSKTDLAQAYFPYVNEQSARHKLMQLICDDGTLLDRLVDAGYRKLQRQFSPLQVEIILNRLGNPFT